MEKSCFNLSENFKVGCHFYTIKQMLNMFISKCVCLVASSNFLCLHLITFTIFYSFMFLNSLLVSINYFYTSFRVHLPILFSHPSSPCIDYCENNYHAKFIFAIRFKSMGRYLVRLKIMGYRSGIQPLYVNSRLQNLNTQWPEKQYSG